MATTRSASKKLNGISLKRSSDAKFLGIEPRHITMTSGQHCSLHQKCTHNRLANAPMGSKAAGAVFAQLQAFDG
jgi:hypothetical protein